ncbi:hypothetical protein C8R44DRAFT_985716 [Mycena epipterygia]|nr:hypothetical protein C8R44DRAFT_985716 [Mycena epipterygia]
MHIQPPALHLHADGLAGADAEGRTAATRDVFHAPVLCPLRRASSCREYIRRMSGSAALLHSNAACCTQFELIVRPHLDRASNVNDASTCPCRSPTPTQRGFPTHAVLWPTPTPTTRSRTTPGHLETGDPPVRVVLLAEHPYPPHAHASCAWCFASHGRDAWARRRRAIIAPPLNNETCPVSLSLQPGPPGSRPKCRLPTLARASDAHGTAPTPTRVPARASAGLPVPCPRARVHAVSTCVVLEEIGRCGVRVRPLISISADTLGLLPAFAEGKGWAIREGPV